MTEKQKDLIIDMCPVLRLTYDPGMTIAQTNEFIKENIEDYHDMIEALSECRDDIF